MGRKSIRQNNTIITVDVHYSSWENWEDKKRGEMQKEMPLGGRGPRQCGSSHDPFTFKK